MKMVPLKPDSKYLFEIISQKDGRKSEAFIATPNQIIDWMDSQREEFKADEMYINFLVDVGAANEIKPDETVGMSDLVMSVPLFSGKAFRLLFRSAGDVKYPKDLDEYDEEITDADFPNPEEDVDNG